MKMRTTIAFALVSTISATPALAWDPVRDLTGKSLHEHGQHIEKELRRAPDSWSKCVTNPGRCVEKEIQKVPYRAVWPIIERYRNDLFNQAEGRWKRIPRDFRKASEPYYSVNLREVYYAESINTWHGQAITMENYIFFPRRIDFDDRGDVHWMLHELEHVVQYERRGGYQALMGEYAMKSIGKVLEKGSVDIHDYIDLERAADRKANRAIDVVFEHSRGKPLYVVNSCHKDIRLAVRYRNLDREWVTAYWYSIDGGKKTLLRHSGDRLVSDNSIFYYYAEVEGTNYAWGGDHSVQVSGEILEMKERKLKADGDDDWYLGFACKNIVE